MRFWWMLLLNMPRSRNAAFFFERQAAFAPSPEVVFCVLVSCGSRALSWVLAALASQLRNEPMGPVDADGACGACGAEHRDGRINPLAAFAISTLPFVYPGLGGFALEAGVTILLAQLGRLLLPALRDLALLGRRLLLLALALSGRGHKRGIENSPSIGR
jgi:hypothetical protein